MNDGRVLVLNDPAAWRMCCRRRTCPRGATLRRTMPRFCASRQGMAGGFFSFTSPEPVSSLTD